VRPLLILAAFTWAARRNSLRRVLLAMLPARCVTARDVDAQYEAVMRRIDADAAEHLAAMRPFTADEAIGALTADLDAGILAPDPDRPVPYWPAYLPAPAPAPSPASGQVPYAGDTLPPTGDPAPLPQPSAVPPSAGLGQPPQPALADWTGQERAAPASGDGAAPLGSLVQPLSHPAMPGLRYPRGEHPYPPMAGNWKETRQLDVLIDQHPVRRWYLAWLMRNPGAGPALTDADLAYLAGAGMEWLAVRRHEMAGAR